MDENIKMIGNKKYILSFYDDFDGTELDMTKWRKSDEQHRQDKDCWWRHDLSYLDGKGNLIIESNLAPDGTHCCGAIETQGKFEQAFGYFECRFKVEKKAGYWSAFWLFNDCVHSIDGGSTNGCEIDIFEHVAAIGNYGCNLHWNGYGKEHKTIGNYYYIDDSFYDDYHIGALEWNEDIYKFYLDGRLIYATVAEGICQKPLYMLLTCEFGDWAWPPKDEQLPGHFIVDYVKAYEMVKEDEDK